MRFEVCFLGCAIEDAPSYINTDYFEVLYCRQGKNTKTHHQLLTKMLMFAIIQVMINRLFTLRSERADRETTNLQSLQDREVDADPYSDVDFNHSTTEPTFQDKYDRDFFAVQSNVETEPDDILPEETDLPLSRKAKIAFMALGVIGTAASFVGLGMIDDSDKSRIAAIEECVAEQTGQEVDLQRHPEKGNIIIPSEQSVAVNGCMAALSQK